MNLEKHVKKKYNHKKDLQNLVSNQYFNCFFLFMMLVSLIIEIEFIQNVIMGYSLGAMIFINFGYSLIANIG